MPRINRPLVFAAGGIAVALVAALTLPVLRPSPAPEVSGPDTVVVADSVPEHQLLNDVLGVVEARRAGQPNFSYVPKERPARLTHLLIGSSDPILDSYQFGAAGTNAFVQFSPGSIDLCADLRRDDGVGRCVREGGTGDPEPTSGLQNFTIYLTARSGGRPDESDAGFRADTRFWATVDMVPLGDAPWFTDLVTRAQSAPKF